MDKFCYSCRKKIQIGSLKTSRTRITQMGIRPPEGMSANDKICTKCLQELYEKQIKQSRIKKLKEELAKDLLHKKRDLSVIPKKIGTKKPEDF